MESLVHWPHILGGFTCPCQMSRRVNLFTGRRSGYHAFDASADSQPFVVNRAGEVESTPITLLAKWTANLKK